MKRNLATWDLHFAESGAEALDVMAAHPVDIVVSDLNMGRMNGAVLLRQVQESCPEIVRIVLSGSTSREEACQTASSAHQFLGKPFDSKDLSSTLRRAASLRTILDSKELRRLVAGKNELPSVPEIYLRLTEVLADTDASLAEVAELVERDPGVSARLMQLTSSAFVGRRALPQNVRQAVICAGTTMIRALVLTHHIVVSYQPRVPGFSIEDVQGHGLRTAMLAAGMLASSEQQNQAFLAGMLHVVGRLVLASRAPSAYRDVMKAHAGSDVSLADAERARFGATHAEVGAYLLGLWGIQHEIVEAVASVHTPNDIQDTRIGPASAVHVASRLAMDPETAISADQGDAGPISAELIERIGCEDRVPAWREAARSMFE